MPFAAGLRNSLQLRETRAPSEFEEGHSLEKVLERHLLTVEQMAHSEVITSILLLSPDGKRLSHGAAPSLPRSYMAAIDGSEIGPSVGSCGTAAYLDRPGLRHRHRDRSTLGTLSPPGAAPWTSVMLVDADPRSSGIDHRDFRNISSARSVAPTLDEIQAIDMITHHVAAAVMLSRDAQGFDEPPRKTGKPRLKLIPGADVEFSVRKPPVRSSAAAHCRA